MKKKLSCVLLVDDDEPTNFLNRIVLEEAGCTEHIQVAQSGHAAITYLKSAGAAGGGAIPDLVFLDINMPAMDGWEFLARYNELLRHQQAEVVVVMLTTSLNPEDEIKAKSIPTISGFLCKPLTHNTLDRLLRTFFPDHF